MCLIYFYNIELDESLLFINSILNSLLFIAILNMYLFCIKQQNQMLIQTLLVFLLYNIINKLYHPVIIDILFISSSFLILTEIINHLRIGVAKNEEKYFNIPELILELTIGFLWFLYSFRYNIKCFIIILLISIFVRTCAILGYQIVIGKIKKDTFIYTFLINFFFIKIDLKVKEESNIL